eukprot:TRINITY_DN9842_c0_g1_i1.p2 TRINITY_DN9842_c0_g1~~TRINITY_DN9842_c0_g1_i1.p2  ORF type:complete len:209 (-),score=18.65 TRINITY_DN9842_c0_g1_i1:265-798(-)
MLCYVSVAAEQDLMEGWLRSLGMDAEVLPQEMTDDFGARMHAAFRATFDQGVEKVIVLGTDVPGLSSSVIEKASSLLESYDVVVGPAADGGYYLIGLRSAHKRLFEDVAWSTSTVLESTVTRAAECGLQLAPLSSLPTLQDLDEREDLEAWVNEQTSSEDSHAGHPLLNIAKQALLA